MQRVKRVSNLSFVDDHDHSGRQRDEIAMRNGKSFPIRHVQSKRMKSVAQPCFDLIYDHALPIAFALNSLKEIRCM